MQIIKLKPLSQYYIWAPLALTGSELVPEKNLLLEIRNNRIVSRITVPKDLLASTIKNHPGFYCLNQGTTLSPCLIDAHIHLALDGSDFNRARATWSNREIWKGRIGQELQEMAQTGIGAVRDGGDCKNLNLEVRKLVASSQYPGPRIIATGEAIRAKGGYGSFLGGDYGSEEAIPEAVDRIWKSGSDQLKIVVSGVVSFYRHGFVKGPIMPFGAVKKIVDSARKRGLKIMAHASSAEAVDLAVQAGVDSVEHGYFVRPEALKIMAEKQIAWVPTIIPVAIQIREPLRKLFTPLEIDVITRSCEEQIEKLDLAHSYGVPLGAGTDSGAAGVVHARNLVEELLLYSKSSLSNKSILRAATAGNAAILGLEKEIGILETGFKAGLIAVRGNPLQDPAALKNVSMHFMPF